MKEQKLAKQLVKDALTFFDPQNMPKPLILIDKLEYKNYNFDTLKQELNNLGFNMIDGTNVKEPYNSAPESFRKQKFFIIQQ